MPRLGALSVVAEILLAMTRSVRRSARIIRTAPGPWYVRLWQVFMNLGIKFRHASRCCGHPGQPGC